jgi:hypothetical protein
LAGLLFIAMLNIIDYFGSLILTCERLIREGVGIARFQTFFYHTVLCIFCEVNSLFVFQKNPAE